MLVSDRHQGARRDPRRRTGDAAAGGRGEAVAAEANGADLGRQARPPSGIDAVSHSDRGSQYTSHEFRTVLASVGMRPSMGRVGPCFDNTVAESFFATLKTEIGTQVWATRGDARWAVFAYLGYYNHDRLHSTLDYRTPHEVRVGYRQDLAPVA